MIIKKDDLFGFHGRQDNPALFLIFKGNVLACPTSVTDYNFFLTITQLFNYCIASYLKEVFDFVCRDF